MKTLFIFIFALLIQQAALGQEFSFSLYLEDAEGYTDTLVFGFDVNATDTLDPSFGEINIISVPFGSDFEARISDFDFTAVDIYSPDATTYHTKTLIKKKDCTGAGFPFVSAILLSNATYPVKVFWNSELFNDACLEKSLITDWHPAAWFDAVHGSEQGPFNLISYDSVNFNHTTHHYITSVNDTIDLLFITLASENNLIATATGHFSPGSLRVFPNPAKDYVQFEVSGLMFEVMELRLFDVFGRQVVRKEITSKQTILDVSRLPNGIYFYTITCNDLQRSGKLIIR